MTGIELRFYNISKDELAIKVQNLLTKEGYNLIDGSSLDGIYEKGSLAFRIFLAGGFSTYNKFSIKITEDNKFVKLLFSTEMTGFSGGL